MRYYAVIMTGLPYRVDQDATLWAQIQTLQAEGRLLMAGSIPVIDSDEASPAGFLESVIIAQFSSLHTAQQWATAHTDQTTAIQLTVQPFTLVAP